MLNSQNKNDKSNCKILHIAPDIGSGGAENILFNIVKSKEINDVFIISLTNIGYYGEKLNREGYKLYALNMKKNIFIFYKIFKLLFLIIRLKPKIVHTWLYHSNLIGGLIAKLLGVKKIYWSIHHDFEYSNFLMMLEMKILIFMSKFVPDKIIYCSEASKYNHIKNGYSKRNSKIIYNGVSTKDFKPNESYRKEIRNKLNIADDCLLLGNISRYHPLKDHDNLLEALFILNKFNINFKCILIGQGLSNENLEIVNKINSYKLMEKIILYGKSYKINKIINAFDLNILSSKKESSPLVLLEAMATGVPCISTDVGDARKIISDTGWVVESLNPKALANCIIQNFNEKNIIKNKSTIARQRIKDLYSIKKMQLNYIKLYE